jgi:hypothetical protein
LQVTKLLLVLVLTLSLSAQAFTGALLPCQMKMQISAHGHGAMQMPGPAMDHSAAMDHSQMSADSMAPMDCCLQECKCPKAACASMALLNTSIISLDKVNPARQLGAAVALANGQASNLIRPPIFS